MLGSPDKVLQFATFTLDPNQAKLEGPGGTVPLRPKAFDVLLYLARHPGRLVSKDELIETVWPNVFVTENSLVQCISDIRAALKDQDQSILKTVARRGYVFTAQVSEAPPPSATAPLPLPDQPSGADKAPEALTPAPVPASTVRVRSAIAALVIMVVAGLGWWWANPSLQPAVAPPSSEEAAALPRRMSIAVLPFTTGDASGGEYLADGLTEDIIGALARFSELTVLAPRTVAAYKGRTPTRDEIARDLKVRYLAEGSIRRIGERLRISVRLADASDGTLLWSDQYDAGADQLLAIQDEITRQITGALAVRVTNTEQARIAARPPASLEAYDLVLRGRDLLSRLTRTATSDARRAFERAIELDANYAPAYVGLGRADLVAVHLGWTPDPAGTLRRAESHARRAIGIDEFNPAAQALLGRIYTRLGEYDRAVEALRQALALNPSDPEILAGLGDALLWNGELEEARKMLEVAARLDPKLPSQDLFNLGATYFLMGNYSQAAQIFERAVARKDGNQFIHAMLAAIYADAGRKDEAAREIAEVRRQNPFFDLETFGSLFRNPAHQQKIVGALKRAGL